MKAIRIPVNFYRRPPFGNASDAQIGAWVKLVCYCFENMTSGKLAGAKRWGNSAWSLYCGVDAETVQMLVINGLAIWEVDDLTVVAYPIDDELSYSQKVEAGRRGGQSKSQKARLPADPSGASSTATALPVVARDREGLDRTGLEGRGEERTSGDFLTKPDSKATVTRQYTLGDLEATNPVLVVFRDDRHRAETILALYGWKCCVDSLAHLGPPARTRPPGKQRVTVNELATHLDSKYTLTSDDYRRAGIEPPTQGVPRAS